MGQYALLAVLAVAVLGAVVLFNAQKTAQAADDDLTAYHEDRFGREVALVGLKRTERLLSQDPDNWRLITTDYDGAQTLYGAPTTTYSKGPLTGTYSVTYDQYTDSTSTTPKLAHVTAVSYYNGERFTIKAVYEEGDTDFGLPPQYRQAILADQRLYINGNVEISGGIHTNDELDSSGNSFDVYGSATAVDSTNSSINDGRVTGGFTESDSIAVPVVTLPSSPDYSTPGGVSATLVEQNTDVPTGVNSLTSTGIDGIEAILSTGGTTNFTVTGNGTDSDPYEIVVNGNLTLSGDVRLKGHVNVYATGDIVVSGNAQIAPVDISIDLPDQFYTIDSTLAWRDTHLTDGNTIGLFAQGDVDLAGNCTIVAQITANGTVDYVGGGHRIVLGGITTGQPLEVRGNAQIVYTQANQTVVSGGNTMTPDGVRLVAYREWAGR